MKKLIDFFRRNVNEMFAAVESDYNRIHENHKLDPPTSSNPAS